MDKTGHIAIVIGGAVAGSEAAYQLSEKGITTVVIEKNALPYGKIEDGLPKWHIKLRNREIDRINQKLNHPLVHYVPNTELGKTVNLETLLSWGADAIVLANGAWKDRPLTLNGIDKFEGKGFYYQNDFIYWFNHQHEPNYKGPQYKIKNNAIIIGGGLASIDCAKAIMFHLVNNALNQKGFNTNLFELEHGIPKVLTKYGVSFEELNIEPCTIYYRKRFEDMSLAPLKGNSAEEIEKAEKTRVKILDHNKSKFLFKVSACASAKEAVIENNELKGIVFNRTMVENGTYKVLDESFAVHSPFIISSIGSIPEPIKGIIMQNETYDIDKASYQLKNYNNVYALGNAVTGRGNINQSLKNATEVAQIVAANISDSPPKQSAEKILKAVQEMQKNVNFVADYSSWIAQHQPLRLEDMLEQH